MNVLDMFRLDGKVALVTGCKRGIGKAMAVGVAEAGADVIGVSSTLETSVSEIEKEITALGRNFKGYQCDFSHRPSLYDFISQVRAENPVIDILFCNAGMAKLADCEEFPDEYWDKILEVNLNSNFVLSREIGKDMLARGKGKIVFTGSVQSFRASTKSPAYAASKGAIKLLTRTLANVWASRGINVNAIGPGTTTTPITKDFYNLPGLKEGFLERTPMGRFGEPEDIGKVALFLASEYADWFTGQIIFADGGQSLMALPGYYEGLQRAAAVQES